MKSVLYIVVLLLFAVAIYAQQDTSYATTKANDSSLAKGKEYSDTLKNTVLGSFKQNTFQGIQMPQRYLYIIIISLKFKAANINECSRITTSFIRRR
ncbi:hypothetical protein BH10BAC2_BH10BAC2_48470 [soil metagenome]